MVRRPGTTVALRTIITFCLAVPPSTITGRSVPCAGTPSPSRPGARPITTQRIAAFSRKEDMPGHPSNATESLEPSIARVWQLRSRTLTLGGQPRIMGIVNVTPDSFSDGGQFADPEAAARHAMALLDAGADLLDIGGESTRPYSEPVSTDQELARVMPVIERLVDRTDAPLSIDTSKAAVARAALEAGAEIINDVTGLEGDPDMVDVAREFGAGVCVMHMQGTPQTMQDAPRYDDVVRDIVAYLLQRKRALLDAGIAGAKICLDPGIGFGKTHEHNWQLVARAHEFHATGCPILVGHSRKGFIQKVSADRDLGTAVVTAALADQRIQIVRVHSVAATRDALAVWSRIASAREPRRV